MKKLLLSAALVLFGATATFAQDTETAMKRYLDATNIDALSGNRQSMMFDMTTKVVQGGTDMSIETKIIQANPGNKMRIEMEMMGQKIIIVLNDKQGWMQTAGHVQPLPEAQLAQLGGQNDILSNLKWDTEKYTFEYIGVKDGIESIKVTPKEPKTGMSNQIIVNFDQKTGLIESLDTKIQDKDAKTVLADYKLFGDVRIPSVMTTLVDGKEVTKVIINSFELNYPTAEYMFVEPKI